MSLDSYLERFTKCSPVSMARSIEPVVRVCYSFPRLPNDWRKAETDGCIFFYRPSDRVTTWAHPIDQILELFLVRISENPAICEHALREMIVGSASIVLTCDTYWIETVAAELWRTYSTSNARKLSEENESCSSFGSCYSVTRDRSGATANQVYPPSCNSQQIDAVINDTDPIDVVLDNQHEDVTFSSSQFLSSL